MPVALHLSATRSVVLNVPGTRKRGPFNAQDMLDFQRIVPHVARALKIDGADDFGDFRSIAHRSTD
jgi:hypothetical protein